MDGKAPMSDGWSRIRLVVVGLAFAFAATEAANAAPVSKGSGAKMCVLTQVDFRQFGTIVWTKPTINIDQDGENVYCVYRGPSGAKGGVELDVFYPAGESATDIEQTFKTVLGSDPGARYLDESVPGADASVYSLNVPQEGYFPFAANAVRRGSLVFSISLPSSPFAKMEMLKLSQLVLERLER
jgi:hypothetical protein